MGYKGRAGNSLGGIVGVLALVALTLAGFLWWRGDRGADGTPAFDTVKAERGDVVRSVLATGRLNPVRTVQVGSQISGNIIELLADFNSQVRRGEVVARLDPAIYQADVSLAEAELERAEAANEVARANWERLRALREREMASVADFDEARARMRQAQANARIAQHELEKARLELERCTIVSPVDGMVISRNVDVGQTVAASLSAPVLFLIAEDLTQMEISTFISEADIGEVRQGQRVEFRVDAYRDETFRGEVWQVRNSPTTIDNVVTYDAVVRVENEDLRLKPGMTAEVHLITEERRDVLRLRNSALRARLPERFRPASPAAGDDGRRRAYLLEDGETLRSVRVAVGISDGAYSEILDGLEEGDELVTGMRLQAADADRSGPALLQGRQEQF